MTSTHNTPYKTSQENIELSRNSNTFPKTLKELAKDKNWKVRSSVANNINTTIDTLGELSKDECVRVRWSVANNINTPQEVLFKLAQDENEEVRRAARANSTYKIIEVVSGWYSWPSDNLPPVSEEYFGCTESIPVLIKTKYDEIYYGYLLTCLKEKTYTWKQFGSDGYTIREVIEWAYATPTRTLIA